MPVERGDNLRGVAATITEHGYPNDHATNVELARAGTAFFLDTVARISDAELDAASELPDWTRRHVIAHVARNAEGVCRLLSWARTGEPNPMYPSPEFREAGIEASAKAAPAELRADVAATGSAFLTDCDALPEAAWSSLVETTRSGPVPAAVVPWFRSREVWIHAADLGVGVRFADFPARMNAGLVTELATGLNARAAADLTLVASDTDQQWTMGGGATRVEATLAELAEWLTGRMTRPEADLPPWI